jgi:hypothetical protein
MTFALGPRGPQRFLELWELSALNVRSLSAISEYTHRDVEGCSDRRCRQRDGRAAILGRSDQRMPCAARSVHAICRYRTSRVRPSVPRSDQSRPEPLHFPPSSGAVLTSRLMVELSLGESTVVEK